MVLRPLPPGREAEAEAAVTHCREVLPGASLQLLERFPLKDSAKVNRLRHGLHQAGLPG